MMPSRQLHPRFAWKRRARRTHIGLTCVSEHESTHNQKANAPGFCMSTGGVDPMTKHMAAIAKATWTKGRGEEDGCNGQAHTSYIIAAQARLPHRRTNEPERLRTAHRPHLCTSAKETCPSNVRMVMYATRPRGTNRPCAQEHTSLGHRGGAHRLRSMGARRRTLRARCGVT